MTGARLASAGELLDRATARVPAFLDDLRELCAIDSGSYDPAGVNAVAAWCVRRFHGDGLTVERIPSPGAVTGDLVVARRAGALTPANGGRRVLLLAHMDTVFPAGTAAARPVTVEGDRVGGPGVTDDKGGLLAAVHALAVLAEAGCDAFTEIVLACTPDEEIGSPFSRPHLEALASRADAGFCLECARENGDVVSARKGVFEVEIEVSGRAAHAGVEPERGRNAILEAARKTVALHELNGRWAGVTVNVGVVSGGTRPNVVPAQARLHVDVRAPDRQSLAAALAGVEGVTRRSWVAGTTATHRRLSAHWPMERTPGGMLLVRQAQAVAAELGFPLRDAATGGAADANTVAAVGLPVLDGLGPIGGDDHSEDEWLALSSVGPRIALLAGLLARVGSGAVPARLVAPRAVPPPP